MGYGIRACDEKVPGKAVGGVDCPLEDVRKAIDIIALLRVYDTTLIETIRLCEIFSSLGGSSVQHLLEELFGGEHVRRPILQPHKWHLLSIKLLQLQRISRGTRLHESRMIILIVVP